MSWWCVLCQVVSEWDATFVEVDQETLFELILAANYMDIKPLLDLTCAKVASMIKGVVLPPLCLGQPHKEN